MYIVYVYFETTRNGLNATENKIDLLRELKSLLRVVS